MYQKKKKRQKYETQRDGERHYKQSLKAIKSELSRLPKYSTKHKNINC